MCSFGKGHYDKHFCEIILNLNQCFKRRCLKDISCLELCQPFVQQSRTVCAIFVEGIMRNTSVKLILNCEHWFRKCCLKDFLSGALVFGRPEPFIQLW